MVWVVAEVVLLLAGLLVPGAAWARTLRVPCTVATSFAGSAVSLYFTVLALQFASIRISLVTLSAGLFAITALARLIGRGKRLEYRQPQPAPAPAAGGRTGGLIGGMGAWTPLYTLFLAIVVWRVWQEPLSGPDIEFRWSFLAEQMLRLGSLDYYPPRTASDFVSYFWVESIPPGASALHAWAYACAGGFEPRWTMPVTLLQLWSIHELLWQLGARIGGAKAARYACLAAAACPFLTWSVWLGQETGLTALSTIGIAFALHAWIGSRQARWAALAGIFAALGASAREYGLVFPALAACVLAVLRADRSAWLAFAASAALSLLWPLRILILTGNPLYSLPLARLPTNNRFVSWIEHDADAFGQVLHGLAGWSDVMRYVILYALPALIGWLGFGVAAVRRRREAALALGATLVLLSLWAASVRYTNGGLFYSLRVASPAFTLGAIAFGIGCAQIPAARRVPALAVTSMLLILAFTLPATLALPANPWRTPARDWPVFKPHQAGTGASDASVRIIVEAAQAASPGEIESSAKPLVLADSPGYQRRFRSTGLDVVPLWSPQADWLFDPGLTPAAVVRHWRESGIRYIILTKWQQNLAFFNLRSRWGRPPLRVKQIGETDLTAIFSIAAVE